MAALNARFEAEGADPPESIWAEWLWGSDLSEPINAHCFLNRNQLLGILIARYRAARQPELMKVCVSLPHLVHQGTMLSAASPVQLKHVMDDLHRNWTGYVESEDPDELTELVDACMARFGAFNLAPTVYMDPEMCDTVDPTRMHVLCMRRLISMLCVFYRHLDLMHRCVAPPQWGEEHRKMEQIEEFHVESSMDQFQDLMMRADLPLAGLLLYKQDFAGYYHCVSQAVYFYYADYERRPQLDVETLRQGEHPVHTLACMLEMYPEIHVCYEEEQPRPGVWNWMLMGKRLYLLDTRKDRVYFAPNILQLMAAFFRGGESSS